MRKRRLEPHARGWVQTEFILLIFLIMVLLILLLSIVSGGGTTSVPLFRSANATYAYSALERLRVAVLSYQDMFGVLPGDDPRPEEINGRMVAGDEDGKIEFGTGEADKAFIDLAKAGILDNPVVRIRSRTVALMWVRLLSENAVEGEGNFFKIAGFNRSEAEAFDRKYDDGFRNTGDVLFFDAEDDSVDFYYRLTLLR